jgi:hypothetical protein
MKDECDCAQNERCSARHSFTTGLPYGHSCSCYPPTEIKTESEDHIDYDIDFFNDLDSIDSIVEKGESR